MAKSRSIADQITADIADVITSTYETAKKLTRSKVGSYLKQIEEYAKGAEAANIAGKYLTSGTTTISTAHRDKTGEYVELLQKVVNFNKRYKEAKEKAREAPGLKKQVEELGKEAEKLRADLKSQKQKYDGKLAELQKEHKKSAYVLGAIEALRKKPVSVYEKAVKYVDEEPKPKEKSKTPNELEKLKAITFYENQPTEATEVLQDILKAVIVRDGIKEASDKFIADMNLIVDGKSPGDDSGDAPDDGAKKPSKKK